MERSRLTPFDAEVLLMIDTLSEEDCTVEEHDKYFVVLAKAQEGKPRASITHAVMGKWGMRFKSYEYREDGTVAYKVAYDKAAGKLPDEERSEHYTKADPTAGERYCRKLCEIDAMQVNRNHINQLQKFTGGGTMVIPRSPFKFATYTFATENGVLMMVPEDWYITVDENGKFSKIPPQIFKDIYEPKSATTDVYDPCEILNEKYGTNITVRLMKLKEEVAELEEAINERPINAADIVDEIADVYIITYHMARMMGKTPNDLLFDAMDKIEGRATDCNYRRKQKREPSDICCGKCAWFIDGGTGRGYCKTHSMGCAKNDSCDAYSEKRK